ncbi:MAG: GNAT family N-acetyltransferase [Ruminococcaceae bacterium]|nr:GNAT family N-acetyltransferase [Oscillospiraceae bacterium]
MVASMNYNIDELEIRQMEMRDRPLVQAFFAQMGEESTSFFNRGHGNENRTLAWFDGKKPDHIFWIAVAKNDKGEEEIAGYVFIWDKDSKIPWLGIAVAEAWKGRHLGRRLIAAVRAHCESVGCGGILLTTAQHNFRGQGLYEHCGFERLGVHHDGEFLYLLRFPNT